VIEKNFITAAAEIVARYRRGERLFDDVEVAEGDSFAGAMLAGATFRNSWLSGVNFNGADLRDTVFEAVNLKCIDFRGADLRGGRFIDVVFCGSDLSGAKYEGSSVREAFYYGWELKDLSTLCESSPRNEWR
jgi:uncharacterized protein YjbI with pentapeptide repeats